MSHAIGGKSYFGWAEQVAFATAVTPPVKWVECESIEVGDERKIVHKPLLGHVSRRRVIRDKHAPSLKLKFPFLTEGIEQLIKAAMGAVVTTGTNPYTHTYALAADLPAGFTSYVDIDDAAISGDHAQQIIGCQIDKLTITQEMGSTLNVELEIVGREFVDVARTAPTLPTYDCFDYGHMTLATINPGSANYEMPIKMFKLMIDNQLYKDKYLLTGAGKRAGFGRAAQRIISYEAEIEYESDTTLAYFKAATSTDLRFKWVSSAKELTLTTPKGYFQGSRPGAADPGVIHISMPFDAVMSSADNDELVAILINTISAV
jgi:hypothetical protein